MLDWTHFKDTLKHKKIAIFGLGKSGLSTIKACVKNGLTVSVWDDNKDQREKAEQLGAQSSDLTTDDLSGYDLLILAPGIHYMFEPHTVVQNAAKYDLEIIGDVELLHRIGIPCETIGITGTNGKSTTTALMNHILNYSGKKSIMAGNIGVPVFDIDFSQNIDFLVLELSSYQLDLCPTYHPNYSILLNITSDHLDRHGSMEAYVAAKEKILEGKGSAVISVDDDFTQVIFDKCFLNAMRECVPVSVHHEIPEGYFIKKNVIYQNHKGENIKLAELEDIPTLKGAHNFQNILCCFVTCLKLGLNKEEILESLVSFSGLPHRQFHVAKKDNINFVNDSKATNAEAAAKALSAYKDIFWIIGGRPKKDGLHGLDIFKDNIVKTYIIGEAKEFFPAWLKHYGFIFEECYDLEEATKKAYQDAKDFDMSATILLSPACASWDQFLSFEERGNNFTDVVKEITK